MTPETSIYEYAKQGLALSADKTAIWFYGRSITYRELFRSIDNVADNLYRLGVRQGTVVTIHLPNCPQAVMAIYAVAKLGGICNMVHALLPAQGLKANMAFTESTVLITGNHTAENREINFADKILYVDISSYMGLVTRLGYTIRNKHRCPAAATEFRSGSCTDKANAPEQKGLTEECAVYMHSSGTVGDPKTVMLSHEALNNWVEITKVYFRNTQISKQVCLSALPYFHALGFQMDMHRVISCGGTLVLMARWDAKTAVRMIKKHRVTVMAGVPAMCQALIGQKDFSGPLIRQLRSCYIGGEKMDRSLKQAMNERLCAGDIPCVFEGYGLTETASACAVLEKDHYHIEASGYPQYGILSMVLKEDGSVASEGEGELIIGGNCLMMGYLKDPAATKQAYIEWNGRKLLRTGDYGRIDEEGLIYFKERVKNMIVRKGNNIFPSEVESVICMAEGAAQACVIGVPDEVFHTQAVCACIVPKSGAQTAQVKAAVLSCCRQFLPAVAVPTKVVFMHEFPQTPMAKIDRRKMEQLILQDDK